MKHLFFTAICVTFINALTAQITIRRTDFAMSSTANDSSRFKDMNANGAAVPTGGNNKIWDYTTMRDVSDFIGTNYTLLASSFGTPPIAFSKATFAYDSEIYFPSSSDRGVFYPARYYQLLDSTGYYDLGYSMNGGSYPLVRLTGNTTDSVTILPLVNTFQGPPPIYKFPMTANAAWKGNYKEDLNFLLTIPSFGLDKTPGNNSSYYEIQDTIIGWGTLKMHNPSGGSDLSFAVLLDKFNATRVDSFLLEGRPVQGLLQSVLRIKQGPASGENLTYYNFYGIGFNQPHLVIVATSNRTNLGGWRAVLPNQGLSVDTKELGDMTIASTVFPNPTTEGVTFDFDKTNAATWNVMIYNTAGQIISINKIHAPQGAVSEYISLDKSLPSGTYFYNILDDYSLIRATGKFQFVH